MKLLGWEPVLSLAEPICLYLGDLTGASFAWEDTTEACAWRAIFLEGHAYGYHHPNDAQNDAARGVIEALRCPRAYEVFLMAEKLK